MKNNGYFMTYWMLLWNNVIKNSCIYKLLCGIYSFISKKWQESRFVHFVKNSFFTEDAARKSLVGKICFYPFLLIESIHQKYSEKLIAQKEKSSLIRFFKYLLHNFLAINLRFIGLFTLTAASFDLVISIIRGSGLWLSAAAMVLGALLTLPDVNLVDYLKGSALVSFVEKCLDTKFSFSFYYLTKCEGKPRLYCAVVFGAICGIICGLTSPLLALVFILGLLFVMTVIYKVEFGVFVTLFLAPLVPTMAVAGLCLLCLLSLVIKALTTKKFAFRLDGTGLLVILLLLVYLVASLTSFAPMKSIQIWAIYFAFISFYFTVVNTIKTKKQLFDLLKVFVLSAVLVCLYGLFQYATGQSSEQSWVDNEMFEDIKLRIYSTLENPNVLGEYILLTLPISISLLWTSKSLLSRITYLGFSGIMGIALILTFSRGCWLGIIGAAAVFITFVAGKLWGLALIALPLLPFIIPESILNRFTSIGDMSDSSTSYRVSIWLGTLLMLKDYWLTGVGPGTEAYTAVYPFYSHNLVVAQHAHNLFLHITSESGIIGLLTFIALMLLFFKRTASGASLVKKSSLAIALVGIAAAQTGFLIQGVFDNCFYNYRVFMIFWAVLAVGMAAVSIAKAQSTKEAPNPDK